MLWNGVAFLWISSICISIPAAVIYDTYSFPGDKDHKQYCHPVYQAMDRKYTIAKTIITFFLPLLIIFAAYTDLCSKNLESYRMNII